MMKAEFEKLAGYEVSTEDYNNIIEPMYMATDLSKEEFVKVIDRQRFALKTREQIIRKMKMYARHLKDTCDKYTDYEVIDKLNKLAEEYKERFCFYGFLINSKYTLEHLGECRGCTYPAEIEYYNSKYHTIDRIKLV